MFDPIISDDRKYVANMFKKGWMIDDLNIRDEIMMDFVTDIDINAIRFWYPLTRDIYELMDITSKSTFINKSLEFHKKRALSEATSIPLIFINPELIYKESRRPITDMTSFKQPISIVSPNKIPVTRYATSMSGRLFSTITLDPSGTEYIGTFYYYEKESTTFLSYNTSMTFRNKYHCLITLDINNKYKYLRDFMEEDKFFMSWHNGVLSNDLLMTPLQACELRRWTGGIYTEEFALALPQVPHYAGHYLTLYAKEDILDQAICQLGRDNGIDIIILTDMVGSFKVVTEVLDTRDRLVSFSSLIYND